MLRLTELFDIKADIYRQIPQEQLQNPNNPSKILSSEECHISIIGHESDGIFIVSRNGYSKKVCVSFKNH
jgi:hypothetical protein